MPIQQKLTPPVLLLSDFAVWENAANTCVGEQKKQLLLEKYYKIIDLNSPSLMLDPPLFLFARLRLVDILV